ncbi:MAG: pilus assembly PilX family protein, partial [Candidatus Binatia bacterium]
MKNLIASKPSERGSAMVVILALVISLMLLTIAGLSAATSNLKISRNFRTGIQAMLAAEAGAIHAQERISDWGVIRFQRDVVDVWDDVYGGGWREMPGHPLVRYSSTIEPDPVDPNEFALLTTVGQAPDESTRRIFMRLQVDQVFSPGAIYLPNDTVESRFNGVKFLVDGHDKNLDGTPNPEGDVPGITTRNEEAKKEVVDSLSGDQQYKVVGDGGTPSVELSYGPTVDRIQNEIAANVLAQPGVVRNPPISGNDTFGTKDNPQITHFTGNVSITGTMDGAGILIVDQGLKITGDMTFVGLILVRGTTEITTVDGNATVLGAIWTTDLKLRVQGSASVTYST